MKTLTVSVRPGALARAAQRWWLARRYHRVCLHIAWLKQHRDWLNDNLRHFETERSRLAVARIDLDALP